jgi:hypothetical protein
MIRFSLIAFICIISIVGAGTITAQTVETDTEQSLLPEIDPQDIEIRSQFQARFPGLRRQPILGFNPRPRVFQTDPDRLPFIESYAAVAANLPVGALDRADAPEFRPLGYSTPRNAFFRGGIGSYFSPEMDLFATTNLSSKNWISGSATLRSSNGHDEQVTTSYRFFDASIKSFNRLSDRTDLTFTAGVESNFNHMLQFNTRDGDYWDTHPIETFQEADTRIEFTGFNASTELNVASTSLSGIRLSLDGFTNSYDSISDIFLSGESSEWGIGFNAEYSRLGNQINEIHRVRFKNETGSINPLFLGSESWSVSSLSAHYERLFNYRTDVKASLGFSSVTDATEDFKIYFSPEIEVKHRFFTGFNIRGHVSATPSHSTYYSLQRENRFFGLNSTLQHQYEILALGEVLMEPFYGTKILAGVSFQDVKNFQYYSRDLIHTEMDVNLFVIGEAYYTADYMDANIFRVYGGVSQDLRPNVIWINVDGHWQIPKLSNGDKIPYSESLSLKAAVSVRPARDLLIEGWGEYSGNREDHLGESLSSYVLLGGRFEVSLSEKYGIYGKLLNILNEDYELWSGYQERGFQGFVGFTYIF